MSFMDLPDHCLLLIFDCCELNTLTTLTTVCTKLKLLICTHIFHKNNTFDLAAKNKQDIARCLVSVARLVRAVNPSNFHVQVYRNLQACKEMPIISVDTATSSTEVFVESHFMESLHCLNNICDRITAVTIYMSIYDCHDNDVCDLMNFETWSNIKKFSINGHDKSTRHYLEFPENIWDVDIMSFGCMFITNDIFNDAVGMGENLKHIIFQNCKLEYLHPVNLIMLAETVRRRGGHFPLGLTFTNVEMNSEEFLEAMLNDDVQTYVFIQIESIFSANNLACKI
ncbi:hypothetical protein HA402_006123 [Bradysia odoriphaga]|nr:hypothetical protein HA402_006123 [Bradysia odoriphaga]